ncbi:MAG: transposase [Thaumarchaeota archaeon]|nr:transposase [Nitrososphaerota archaeon]
MKQGKKKARYQETCKGNYQILEKKYITRIGRITKKENRLARWYLIEAAHLAARHDPKLKPFYERIARRKGNQKAAVAVARKILYPFTGY